MTGAPFILRPDDQVQRRSFSTTLASSASVEYNFETPEGLAWDLQRLEISNADDTDLRLSLYQGERTPIFVGVPLYLVTRMLTDARFRVPITIEAGSYLRVVVENAGSSSASSNFFFEGFYGATRERYQAYLQQRYVTVPTPYFLYGSKAVTANASDVLLSLNQENQHVAIERMALVTTAAASSPDITVDVSAGDFTLLDDVDVLAANTALAFSQQISPLYASRALPLRALLSESNGGTATVHGFALAYLADTYQPQLWV